MTEKDEYFPRGGQKPNSTLSFKATTNFLGKPEHAEKKKKKRVSKSRVYDGYLSDDPNTEYDKVKRICAESISYKVLQNGTILLGRVQHIHETKLTIALPGRMQGTVVTSYVSLPYNKILQEYVNDDKVQLTSLFDLFKEGEYVLVKVLEIKFIGEKPSLILSMLPQHINKDLTINNIKIGALLKGAVESVEDHGYLIDLGVSDCRVFLPNKLRDPSLNLNIGQNIWCTVTKCSLESKVITVSNNLEKLQDGVVKGNDLNGLLPGMAVDFNIDEALLSGIQGHFFGELTGYIQRPFVEQVKGKKPSLGQRVRARLLYIMPTSNIPFFTMKNIFTTAVPDLSMERQFKDGDFVDDAKVVLISSRSIVLRLPNKCVGQLYVRNLKVDEELSDEDVISKMYPLGSEHRVRILHYNLYDYMYVCTDDPRDLNQKYFTMSDFSTGQLVEGVVKAVKEIGIQLQLGKILGLVPTLQISDMGIFESGNKASVSLHMKKYREGQSVKARVLLVQENLHRLILTMKPSFLDPNLETLKSIEEAVVGNRYTGFVHFVKPSCVVVRFFNNVQATVFAKFMSKEHIANPASVFRVGEIVKCTILYVDVEKKTLSGSFTTPPFDSSKPKEKKRKTSESATEEVLPTKPKEKKRKTSESATDEVLPTKVKKSEVKKPDSDEKINVSETSDDDSEQEDLTEFANSEYSLISTEELALLNLDSCDTIDNVKNRISLLLTASNRKIEKLNKIESVLDAIENKGITTKNKKIHSLINSNKFATEDQLKALMSGITKAQDKLKKLLDEGEKVQNETKSVKPKKKKKSEKSSRKEEVVQSSEEAPKLVLPSVKDFWSMSADALSKDVNQAQAEEDSSSSSDEEKTEEQPKKKKKKLSAAEKVSVLRAEEEQMREAEAEAVQQNSRPHSSEQFERLLLANPNSSELWIAYMAFYLQATEIEKARSVGRKALSTISFREEEEKLNVWLAMLNFENSFGTQESQQKTLEEALQMNDTFKVHSKLLDIYAESGKSEELTSLAELMLKRYKALPHMYTLVGAACYKLDLKQKARFAMQRAIQILDKKEHITVIVQFALLEHSQGDRERAEALLEQVVGTYPTRVDVWCVYADMLAKNKDILNIRQVMERAVSHKIPARKMKTLYKKWIEMEEKLGSPEHIERIRQKALEFIEKAKC